MKRTATKEDTLKSEFLNIDDFCTDGLSKAFTKFAIGYAYGITAFIASLDVATTLMMLSNVAWIKYVILFAALVILLVASVKAAPYVIDGVYDGGAWAANKAKSLFTSAKAKFNAFEMPAFATKH
jgi:hypothetical protein